MTFRLILAASALLAFAAPAIAQEAPQDAPAAPIAATPEASPEQLALEAKAEAFKGRMESMAGEIRATVHGARSVGQLVAHANALDAAWRRVEEVTQALYAAPDLNQTLANATVYLEAVGHVVVAWIWLQQAMAAVASRPEEDNFRRGILQDCRYFYKWELPKVQPQLDLLANLDTTTLDMQDAWF